MGVCASQMGLESYKADDFVSVKYDETASLCQAQDTVKQMSMFRPGLTAPAACDVR